MKKSIFTFLFLLHFSVIAQIDSSIIISEIMFAPIEADGEFIELYNTSSDSSINLAKFQIIYSTSSADTIIELNNGAETLLPPKSFAIVFEDDYNFIDGMYLELVPDVALILRIDNGKFGSRGMANTSNRTIYLLNEVGDTIDTYSYSANNSKGISDEKIDLESLNIDNNWGNSVVTHGTPGSKNSISPKDYDLEFSSLSNFPEDIFEEDEIEFSFVIKNIGKKEATNFEIKLFIDLNHDSLYQSEELLLLQTEFVLLSGDSLKYNILKSISKNGIFNVLGEVVFIEDENRKNNSKSIVIQVRPKPNEFEDVVINEIMYKPNSDEPEWVELFNRSSLPINLKDWLFADRTSRPKIIDSLYIIGTKGYLVLSEDETIADYYEIESDVIILNLPSLNNKGDDLKLTDSLGLVIDSVNYKSQWGSGSGYSLERIDVDKEGNDSTNWSTCISKQYGTPGRTNSVTKRNVDLAITDFAMYNEYGIIGEDIKVSIEIANIGTDLVNTFSISLFHDQNMNGVLEEEELITIISGSELYSGDSTIVEYELNEFSEGENRFISEINLDSDENIDNNRESIYFVGVLINEKRNDIVINEIMYSPISPEPEWIEIFNRSSKTINLINYQIADMLDTAKIIEEELILNPNQYFVFADDSSFIQAYSNVDNYTIVSLPNLNNAGDRIILLDSLNRIIDSLQYSSEWGHKRGLSLERINANINGNDSTNWNSCNSKQFGTPGKINSLTKKKIDLEVTEIISLNNYGVMGKSFDVKIKIKNIGISRVDNYSLSLFHDTNNNGISEVEELVDRIIGSVIESGDSTIIEYKFTDFLEKENSYIVKLVLNNDGNLENNVGNISFVGVKINEVRSDIVINEIMYSPKSHEPEWIEIFNRSSKSINLMNYKIADMLDTAKVVRKEIVLNPNQYFVFADDSSFIQAYSNVNNYTIASLPNLNNVGDKVILLDSLNRIIDSLKFTSMWGGTSGNSLERRETESSSIDSVNWGSSNLLIGGTPGIINSISQKNYDIELVDIYFNPEIPKYGDSVNIRVKIKNVGKKNVDFKLILSEDIYLDSTSIIEREISENIYIQAADSLIHQFNYFISDISKEIGLIISTSNIEDQDTANNLIQKSIAPSYENASIVINEIMYSPTNGEAEWVELYNCNSESIDIKYFTISDIYTTPKETIISDTSRIIKPKEFLILVKDSLLFQYHKSILAPIIVTQFANLNNDVDGVVLKDRFGIVIDSMEYKSNWGSGSGYSIERKLSYNSSLDSTNWGSSTDIELSTPGRKNSITPFEYDLMISKIGVLPKSPILGDELTLDVTVSNIGLLDIDNYSAKIFYVIKGDSSKFEEIIGRNLMVGDSLILKFEKSILLSDSISISVHLLCNLDENNINNSLVMVIHPGAKRNTIIINEFMANPNSNEVEWIELLNNSNMNIDISHWHISDLIPSPKPKQFSKSEMIIKENQYVIITNDTSKYFRNNDERVIEVKFGTLGNIEDGIVLYDFNLSIVDSLKYDKEWEIEKGRSLERLSAISETVEYSNWFSSLSASGSSPGVSNSILETEPAIVNSIIINEIMYDPSMGNCEFIELYNSTEFPIDIGGWQLIDGNNNFYEISSTFLTIKPEHFYLFASDSLILNNYGESMNISELKILESGSFSFSNIGESIVIIDHWGNTIDSVYFNPKWHNKNIATSKNKTLERISPLLGSNEFSNWSTSVSKYGATPGSINSIFTENKNKKTGLTFDPNPFSPDNDGAEDFSIINYSLPFVTAQIRIKIFDDKGRLVRTLINNKASSNKGSIIFDGLNDSGNTLRIGMYIVFLEAVDTKSGESIAFKDVIVVARKLY